MNNKSFIRLLNLLIYMKEKIWEVKLARINLHCMYKTSWIGLSDSAAEGSYRWESDNSLVNYTHWGTEEPNDFAGVEDCIAVWGGASAGYWNDDYCDSEKYFICEKPGGMFHCFGFMVLVLEKSSKCLVLQLF